MDEPPIYCRHLLLCRGVRYDPLDEAAAYSLDGVITQLRPTDDLGYPLCVETLWLFAQLYGAPGRYRVWVGLVRIADDGADGGPVVEVYPVSPVRVRDEVFVEGVQIRLFQIAFDRPGVYEFRLYLDGDPDPIASERILLESARWE